MRELLSRLMTFDWDYRRLWRYGLVLLLALITQNMLLTQLKILGVHPLVLPAVVVAVGMFETPLRGAIFALLLGIFADMAFIENTVLFTLLFPAISFASAFLAQFFLNRRFFAFMGAAVAAVLFTGIMQMIRTAAGDAFTVKMLSTVGLQTLWSLPFAPLGYFPVAHWVLKKTGD